MKKVEIEWVDSRGGSNEWEYLDDLEPLELSPCTTVGFVLEETEEYKTIAHTVSKTQVFGRITIPKASIKKVRMLK